MFNILVTIQKRLVIVIPIVMVLGLLFGMQMDVSFLKGGIMPLTFLMVYPMMVTLQLKKVFEGGDGKVQFVTQVINFAITPFFAYFLGITFFKDNTYLALGLLLTGLLPTSGMTISWTGMAKGNIAAAVKMTVIGLLLGSLLTPLYIKFLMGATVAIDMAGIFSQIVIIVILPMLLGNITQRLLLKKYGMAHYQEKLKNKFPPISTLGVIGIVFVAMALKSKSILSHPQTILQIFIPLLILYVVNFLISTLIGKAFFKRDDAIALLYGTVLRNLSIALAIAMTAFGKDGADIALVVALGYVIQIQLSAWAVKFTDKVYGPRREDEAADLMHYGIFSLHQDQTLADVVKMLAHEHIHSLVIIDNEEKPVGIITQKMIINCVANNRPLDSKISQCELEPVVTVGMHQPVSNIVKSMDNSHEYKILVTNEKGKISGIVTANDILNNLIK
ncbi:MAG: bile acid:sodium symporter [Spirochaetales bacterium]|nr:bile acid:sodium symporter [Spirochaetales bacterium]